MGFDRGCGIAGIVLASLFLVLPMLVPTNTMRCVARVILWITAIIVVFWMAYGVVEWPIPPIARILVTGFVGLGTGVVALHIHRVSMLQDSHEDDKPQPSASPINLDQDKLNRYESLMDLRTRLNDIANDQFGPAIEATMPPIYEDVLTFLRMAYPKDALSLQASISNTAWTQYQGQPGKIKFLATQPLIERLLNDILHPRM